jgi:hypothetical protein
VSTAVKGKIKNSFLPAGARENIELRLFLGSPKKRTNLGGCMFTKA